MHHLLIYELVPAYMDRRAQYRSEHLGLAWQAVDRGELVLGGAVGDPVEGAILVFSSDDAARAFAKADPYVHNGLVKSWRVAPWNTVVGEQASNPVRG